MDSDGCTRTPADIMDNSKFTFSPWFCNHPLFLLSLDRWGALVFPFFSFFCLFVCSFVPPRQCSDAAFMIRYYSLSRDLWFHRWSKEWTHHRSSIQYGTIKRVPGTDILILKKISKKNLDPTQLFSIRYGSISVGYRNVWYNPTTVEKGSALLWESRTPRQSLCRAHLLFRVQQSQQSTVVRCGTVLSTPTFEMNFCCGEVKP